MEQRYSCGALVKQIHDALEKDANNMMRPKGLTMAQFSVLMILRETEGLQAPLKELEHALHVAQSTAAGIVSRLEQKRYVTCYTSQEDRRIKMVRLTQEGLDCCRHSDQVMAETEDRILSGMTQAEQDIFYVLLKKVRDSLQ